MQRMPRKDKCKQCSSFTAALCIHSCHFLLCPGSFIPPRLLPLQTPRQRASYVHHRHKQLEPVMALTDFSNNYCYKAILQHADALCTTQFHKFCGRFMLNLKLFSSQKCTRHFWKLLHSKHTIFSCIPPCHVWSCVCFFKLFSYFTV